jgi:hypothetical protein
LKKSGPEIQGGSEVAEAPFGRPDLGCVPILGKETARAPSVAKSKINARKPAFARNFNRLRNLAALKLCE